MKTRINKCIANSVENYKRILNDISLQENLEMIVKKSIIAFKDGKKILFCGNGGSASDAQHIAAELSGRFHFDRPPLYAEALHVNTSYLTAVANDYGYDQTYSRMLEACGRQGDILVGISTSGNSHNVVNALEKANELGLTTVGFTGNNGGQMNKICDIIVKVPSEHTARIQEAHILLGHIICQLIEEEMFANE
tara:strand:- start:13108 stop:13689 length:582 start_codon:yes stop_codon:yes gene_type:complete